MSYWYLIKDAAWYLMNPKPHHTVLWISSLTALYYLRRSVKKRLEPYLIKDGNTNSVESPTLTEHNEKRRKTYPYHVPNTWYHVYNSSDLTKGKVVELRYLGQTLVLWRTDEGEPVCQDAFCIHLGANLAVGGKIEDNCLRCPFHQWKFSKDGSIADIPYNRKNESSSSSSCSGKEKGGYSKRLKTYPCVDWCGLVCVYFDEENSRSCEPIPPAFELPGYIQEELKDGGFTPHLQWNIGFRAISPVDWVDQAGDHSHFNTLHAEFCVPWTTLLIPKSVFYLFPIGITHSLKTYRGDDRDWEERVNATGVGVVNKHLVYFTDEAGLSWRGKTIESTKSETLETYIGPAIMVFHIPFTIGCIKVFVTTTSTDGGGSIMRVNTWIDRRASRSIFVRTIAWILSGIAASQLESDIRIMENKIRLTKPILQPLDGPFNRMNAWLKLFYSEKSKDVGCGYKNDW